MSGYAKVQELRAKLKPFRKYSGHYVKSPEVKQLLHETVVACEQFMTNKPTNELSTINTKILLQWAECAYALGRKFDEKKLLPLSCEKYELVAKFTGPQDDFLVYCKWAIAECEKSLYSFFFKDGRSKKALYKKGEGLFKQSLTIANKSPSKKSRVMYSWALALFRYSRTCETMCTPKEVFRMYQKAGQMFYEAYTMNPANKDAVYKWGKLLDSQALIISHRNDPELNLADDVELFLIVFSSLAMRGKLTNLKILVALCLSPEVVTQQMSIEVLEHLSNFLDAPSQIPPTPIAPQTPSTPFTPALSPFPSFPPTPRDPLAGDNNNNNNTNIDNNGIPSTPRSVSSPPMYTVPTTPRDSAFPPTPRDLSNIHNEEAMKHLSIHLRGSSTGIPDPIVSNNNIINNINNITNNVVQNKGVNPFDSDSSADSRSADSRSADSKSREEYEREKEKPAGESLSVISPRNDEKNNNNTNNNPPNPFESPRKESTNPFGSPAKESTNPFGSPAKESTNPFGSPLKENNNNNNNDNNPLKETSNPFGSPLRVNNKYTAHRPSKLTIATSPSSSPIQQRSAAAKAILPPVNNNITNNISTTEINPANVLSPTMSPAPAHPLRVSQLLSSSIPPSSSPSSPSKAPLDLNLNDSTGMMGTQGEFASPSLEDSKVNQKAIMEEARSTLEWIKQIIVQNHTLHITKKIQALKSLGEEGQRVWRASQISYQEALDNFEIFANCINFHTKRQLRTLHQYLTAPDIISPPTTPSSSSPTPTSPPFSPNNNNNNNNNTSNVNNFNPITPPPPAHSPTGLFRSDSAPIVKSKWVDNPKQERKERKERKEKDSKDSKDRAQEVEKEEKGENGKIEENGKIGEEGENKEKEGENKENGENAENGENKENGENEERIVAAPVALTRQRRSKSFGARVPEEQIIIQEDINKFYVNHNKIGRGGFGDVYTAKSRKTGKTVAIKSMRRNFQEHFKQIKREIKLMKHSVHPNMVNYLESYSCHDHVWIVMEYCDGGSLRQFAKNTTLEESHISYMSKQILQGIAYLHSERRIHRDIKADNVLLNLDGSVKLADLGIAADLDDPDTPSELMNLCGSKFWMAPEMIKFQPYNYKVDIWGFGCLLIELAEGRHPYQGQHSMAAMFYTATKGADSLSKPSMWSDLFKDFLAKCFTMNPAIRPSAEELLEHPFVVLYDTAPEYKEIKQDIVTKLDHVFVGYQLENILF